RVSRPSLLLLLLFSSLAQAAAPAVKFTPPKLVHFEHAVAPPELATRKRVEVVLSLDVDEHGQVQSATVAESGGAPFDEAALAAARRFVFSPGLADGKPVPVRVTYRYLFVEKIAPPAPVSPPPPGAPPRPNL